MIDQRSEIEKALPEFRLELIKVLADIQIQLQACLELLKEAGVKPERIDEEYRRIGAQSHQFIKNLARQIPHAHEKR